MAREKPLTRQLVDEAIRKTPKAASKSIARALRAHHPAVFTSIEQARTIVRRARGAQGKQNRKDCNVIQRRTKAESEQCRKWGALLPDAESTDWGWRELPKGVKRWLILADLHFPYYSESALTTALTHADGSCDGVILLGDIFDAYSLSTFCRDPRCRNFEGEIQDVSKFLDALKCIKPKAIVFKEGNHDFRLSRYLMQRAPELWPSLAERFSYAAILDFAKRGIIHIKPQDPIRIGKLTLMHGHEIGRGISSPVNPARGMYLRAKECVLSAHEHRSSEHTESTIRGTTVTTWSVGAMCDLNPLYRPFNSWNHGLAYLDLTGKEWTIENRRIVNGRVL